MTEEDNNSPYLIGNGTFGVVKKINENTVQKRYGKFDDDHLSYNPCGIKELVFLSQYGSLNKGVDIIDLKSFHFDKYNLYIDMEDGGVSLFDIVMEIEKVGESDNDDEEESEIIDKQINCNVDNYNYHNNNNDTHKYRLADLPLMLSRIIPCIYYLHSNHIIHNDMKPDNMLIHNKTNNIKLIDFSSTIFDKPYYSNCNNNFRAPEVFWNQNTSVASDIWGLGMTCLFYVMNMLLCDRIGKKVTDVHISEYLKYQSSKTTYLHFDESKFEKNKPLLELIKKMLIFDHAKRITAAELFFDPMFYDHKVEKKIFIHKFDDITLKYINNERNQNVETIYKICERSEDFQCFMLSVWIYDLFCTNFKIEKEDYIKIAISSLVISYCINDTFLNIKYYKDFIDSNDYKASKILDPIVTDIVSKCIGKLYIETLDKKIEIIDHIELKKLILSEKYFGKTHGELIQIYNSEISEI
jgi:serine/threonine protein kinase